MKKTKEAKHLTWLEKEYARLKRLMAVMWIDRGGKRMSRFEAGLLDTVWEAIGQLLL